MARTVPVVRAALTRFGIRVAVHVRCWDVLERTLRPWDVDARPSGEQWRPASALSAGHPRSEQARDVRS